MSILKKIGKMSWSKDLVPTKRSYHKEYSCGYRSSSTHCSKVIRKVMVFKKWIKLQGQGHRVINNGTHGKVLTQGIFM